MSDYPRIMLDCGCCGMGFWTWPEYVDQDQDQDYGICFECQDDAEQRNNEMLDDSAMQIEQSLNPKNRKKFQAMNIEARRRFASKAHEEGMFTWHIGR